MPSEFEELKEAMNKVSTHDPRRDDSVTAAPDQPSSPNVNVMSDAKMWAVRGEDYFPCEQTVPSLPPGQYAIGHSENRGLYFIKKKVCLDNLLVFPDSASDDVLSEIEYFWEQEHAFRKFGFLWKRGILLWGPAGSGKSSILQLLSQKIVDRGGFSVYVDVPSIDARGLEILRRIEPIRPIVVMIEDIDAIVRRHGEAETLALLDGELQIDNVTFVSTTNYPERLDKRLINRPSRFDIVKKVGMPSATARRVYLEHKHPDLVNGKLDQWIEATDEFSFAHLKEVVVAVECLGQNFEDVIARLRAMIDIEISSDDYAKKKFVGFERGAAKQCEAGAISTGR